MIDKNSFKCFINLLNSPQFFEVMKKIDEDKKKKENEKENK